METIKRILVVSRMNPYSRKVIQTGLSLARKYDAQLHILHFIIDRPVDMMAVNAPGHLPMDDYKIYKDSQQYVKEQLDKFIKLETNNGHPIKEMVSETEDVEKEILLVVTREKIELLLLSAHEEGRIEHALFGGENDAIIRKMPCSILLVKSEPGSVK